MIPTLDSHLQFDSNQSSKKETTIDTTIEALEGGMSQPDTVVHSRVWLNIPILLRDCDLLEEKNIPKMDRLIQSILQILTVCLRNDISIINRSLLHSSLSTLATSPTLPKTIRVCVEQCLVSLNSHEDGHFVLVDTDEFKSMKEAALRNLETTSNQKEEINQLNQTIATLRQQHKEEKERLTKDHEEASEIARKDAETRIEQLLIEKQNVENTLKESKEREKKAEEREMMAHADRRQAEESRMKIEEEKKKAETERGKIEEKKRKAEERIRNAEEAKRMAEERQKHAEELKGQAEREKEKLSDELKGTRKELGDAREGMAKSEREKTTLKSQNDELKLQLANLPIWVGTESLQTFDSTAHQLTPTTLTQIIKLEGTNECRTAFTFPIYDGECELKIRGNSTRWKRMLGFVRHPLPDDATQHSGGSYHIGIGGDFVLWDGRMWHAGKEFKPAGTNKKCDKEGQTAAIRVNMSTREARLFVDDEEQPGIFTGIPSPLCLGITTWDQNAQIEVLWFKQQRS